MKAHNSKDLVLRLHQTAVETEEIAATWAVHRQDDKGEWQLLALAPSFDTALVALFDAVPWTDATTFSHSEVAPGMTEFTFHTKGQQS